MSLWNWLFSKKQSMNGTPELGSPDLSVAPSPSATAEAPPPYTAPPLDEQIRDQMRLAIAAGYLTQDEILQAIVDMLYDEAGEEELYAMAASQWSGLVAEQRALQAEWPEVTDYDRLDAAFRSMEAKGIVARQNFTCCGTCGSTEIWDEIEDARSVGADVRGYAFFHMQDTDRGVEGHGVYLNYGACEEGEGPAIEIANDIVAELRAHDLAPHWNGASSQRIGVPLDWKRRVDYAA